MPGELLYFRARAKDLSREAEKHEQSCDRSYSHLCCATYSSRAARATIAPDATSGSRAFGAGVD